MTEIAQIKAEMQDVVENNILSFWFDKMQDRRQRGFYGQMRGDGTLVPEADKGCILNARILWSFSAAYRILRKPDYLMAATRAKDYILEHFIDKIYGGAYWSLDAEGNPLDTKKQFYAIGFVIYGLTEYARATGDPEAFDYAIRLYDCIEQHSWDPQYGGYIEACTREWEAIADMRLSDLDANYPKSQNTHLHIIEPYTNLFRLMQERPELMQGHPCPLATGESWGDVSLRVEKSLRQLIDIFCDKILNPETHHLDLFFDMDWTRGAGWLERRQAGAPES